MVWKWQTLPKNKCPIKCPPFPDILLPFFDIFGRGVKDVEFVGRHIIYNK